MLPTAELHVRIEGTLEPEISLQSFLDLCYRNVAVLPTGAGFHELAAARSEMNLSGQQLVTLARNSFDACFAPQHQRDRWKAELQAVAAQAPE